ncbi:hypothetical protein C8R43DRAFT_975977 [Mycena crocata]|nr:hypothetical protein C8R43DRAFT_975977 [Mycena crocata]
MKLAGSAAVKQEVIEISVDKLDASYSPAGRVYLSGQRSMKQEAAEVPYAGADLGTSPLDTKSVASISRHVPQPDLRKPRYILDCVEIPCSKSPSFPSATMNHHAPVKREDPPRKTPKRRMKTEDAVLPQGVVAAFMGAVGPFEIKPPPGPSTFSRDLLVSHCGFLAQDLLFHLNHKAARYAGRAVICGTRDINPHLPAQPGDPGLMCSVRQAMVNGTPWSVFVRKPLNGTPRLWMYIGEYRCVLAGNMTPAQLIDQGAAFHSNWAEKILRTVRFDEYVRMRAEIGLIKWGHTITDASVETEMAQIRAHKALPLTEADVIGALSRGEQQISIVRMECVSYDHEFIQYIAGLRPGNG